MSNTDLSTYEKRFLKILNCAVYLSFIDALQRKALEFFVNNSKGSAVDLCKEILIRHNQAEDYSEILKDYFENHQDKNNLTLYLRKQIMNYKDGEKIADQIKSITGSDNVEIVIL